MKHKHHIIPRHIGGTDDPSNLIELTVEEHAEAHRVLYEEHGRWEDYIAWKGLEGSIGSKDIHSEATRMGMKEWWSNLTDDKKKNWIESCRKRPENFVVWNRGKTGIYKHSDTAKKAISDFQKSRVRTREEMEKISENRRGKGTGERNSMANPEHREKQRMSCIGRKRAYREDGSWYWTR